MHSVHPLCDPLLWARWLLAATAVLWLPGHLLVGRWLNGLDRLSTAVTSLGVGVLLVPVLGPVLALAGLPLAPAIYLPAALLVTWEVGRTRAHRAAVAAWSEGLAPLDGRSQIALLACAALTLILVVRGHGDLSAPPHLNDAANHAWLTARVAATGSLRAGDMFDAATGRPELLYLPGWHGAAALMARLAGVAPYVSSWFLPLLLLGATPAALALLWRAWGVPAAAAVLGGLFVAVNQFVPGGVLGWGGFGQIAGFCLLPIVTLAMRGALAAPTAWTGALAGLLLAGLLRVHAGEGFVVLGAAALVWPALAPATRGGAARTRAIAGGAALVGLALALGPGVWELGHDYVVRMPTHLRPPLARVGPSLERFLAAGGKTAGLKLLAALGLLLAWRAAPGRRLAAVSLGGAVLFIALACFGDPVSRWLATPFYGEPARVLYLQLYLLPPLMALVPLKLRLRPLAALLVAAAAIPALPGMVANYRHMQAGVPFGADEYALAVRLQEIVAPAEVVAGFWGDGAAWAMHVSGRCFLPVCSWRLHDADGNEVRDLVGALRERPWPASARALAARGVRYVYVSDQTIRDLDRSPPTRSDLDADPRFTCVARGGAAALYRIDWAQP